MKDLIELLFIIIPYVVIGVHFFKLEQRVEELKQRVEELENKKNAIHTMSWEFNNDSGLYQFIDDRKEQK